MSPIQLVIADNHALVRAGFRLLVEDIDGIEVVGEAENGHEALQLVETLKPQIVLMDIAMPEMNGLEATARIAHEFPQVRVLILSMHANEEYVYQALRSGASGYLLKDSGIEDLERALRAIARGETYLCPAISKYVVSDYVRRLSQDQSPLDQITPRQREILRLIAEGKSTKDIAAMLYISTKTVETHRTQLMDRLDIHDIAGLVRYAIRMGLVVLD
ncbi:MULTISPECIES: response regulator transcription factor [Cyanophyceae]|uniref:response regulator n=1 Tax=Cyanophyceae TaxID=3028117 RepID=UPI00168A0111|nr:MULTISPECIES: response regulator transcription factor [Cyanophyceae]MBD1914595.1 response regulator transcription factor [Phormidium sp. FACHB-77]MBD2030319.1 response regulator transcription factor [Phormidium sp. FACHB-322]MBD2049864.1 response regulator transcription factor [Leptolyngbya sp. FACHB-60]